MASSKLREPADEVFDLDLAVPETVRLDSSLHKARAQLLAKGRRHRPSRSRLRDSASSAEDGEGSDGPGGKVTDGCGSPLHRLRSPLHSSPGSPAVGSFCLEPPGLRRSLDEDEPPPSPLTRYRPLHNAASHEGLAAASSSPPRSAPSSDSSPSFVRRHLRAEPHSEDDSRDASPPEPASPTIGLDKKTRRKFLDLGVTLRRASTSKSRKEKGSNRLSMGSRESMEGSGRSGGSPFLPFSWFTDGGKGSASSGSTTPPACSPKHESFSPKKSASQESTLSDDSTPPSSSPKMPSGPRQEAKCSYPYHTLSQSSDEVSKLWPLALPGVRATGCIVPLTLLGFLPSSWMSPSPPSTTGPASRWASGCTASTWSSTPPSLPRGRWTGRSCCSWMEAN
ncbi:sterile alpha motif domain-containing protein 14 isoform X2 [Sturnira hondurensis]|uniref:sterile alpha motif domain-containing protein 14 isoform X2 n=1 Tax=Sturnira hondurensis TaxID=192404 RepID=UPI0018790361|nr:sterile alpha motif domain-containing protein 14 isoform X2 [Sturnira hondurensis]